VNIDLEGDFKRLWIIFATQIIILLVLSSLWGKVDNLEGKEEDEMATLNDLQNEVTALTTVEESAEALISGLSAQLKAAGTDPAAIQKVIDDLDAGKTALAAAVTANTPAAPPAP